MSYLISQIAICTDCFCFQGIPSELHTSHSLDSQSSPPNIASNARQQVTGLPAVPHAIEVHSPGKRPSPTITPVSVCTPTASPSPAPVFDLPVSGTPTPPPKPATPIKNRESEVKVKLEIPELDDNDNRSNQISQHGLIASRRLSKQSKLKPDPLSISNDVVVNSSVTSPLMTRGILPSLNTPMFLTSPMFGQRTPLIPNIHFWGPGTLSPVATLSPRLGGLAPGPAFQFPAFAAVSPATLASFSTFSDNVFSNAATASSSASGEKKITSS